MSDRDPNVFLLEFNPEARSVIGSARGVDSLLSSRRVAFPKFCALTNQTTTLYILFCPEHPPSSEILRSEILDIFSSPYFRGAFSKVFDFLGVLPNGFQRAPPAFRARP